VILEFISTATATFPCGLTSQEQNHVKLFLRSPTTYKHSEVHQPAFDCVTDTDTTRLRQRNPVSCSWPSDESAPVLSRCLVCHARKYDHVTHLLRDLHWLRVVKRIHYRLAVLSFAVVTTWRLCTSPVTCARPTRRKRYVYVTAFTDD